MAIEWVIVMCILGFMAYGIQRVYTEIVRMNELMARLIEVFHQMTLKLTRGQ